MGMHRNSKNKDWAKLRCFKASLRYQIQRAIEVPLHKRDHSTNVLRSHSPLRGRGVCEELSYHLIPCDGLIAISTNYLQRFLWSQNGNSFQPTLEVKREYSN
ncbi:hypothetical protein TNCV_628421 [Trichonephila clavipes]|nr:hypothetical protein TNCV_628421 [Trichonephila clavipes]